MKNSTLLAIFLLFSSVICTGNFLPTTEQKKGGQPAYFLTLKWPYAKDYWGEKYTRSDFPTFNGDNFAIEAFFPIQYNSNNICYNQETCPNQQPFIFEMIQDCDKKYLSKYIENFDNDNHSTTKRLWEKDGSCYKKCQTQYFSDLVKVHQRFNIVKAFKAQGIVPNSTKVISQKQVDKALSDLLGGKVPTCYCSIYNKEGVSQPDNLRYIHILLDENLNAANQQYTLCKYEYCGLDFAFPAIDY